MTVSAHVVGGEEPEGLLSVDTVGAYVTRRGLVPRAAPIDAVALGGGSPTWCWPGGRESVTWS